MNSTMKRLSNLLTRKNKTTTKNLLATTTTRRFNNSDSFELKIRCPSNASYLNYFKLISCEDEFKILNEHKQVLILEE